MLLALALQQYVSIFVGGQVEDAPRVVMVSTSLIPVVALVTLFTMSANGLSQLCRATSNRSALLRGSGTSILRSKSRAWGVTYSGKVRGVETMYLYKRLMLSPSGFAGSSSNGRYPASIAY